MSQIERAVERLFGREPEIEKCYRAGLLNRRALARYLVARGAAPPDQLDAVVATLRRLDLGPAVGPADDLFRRMRIGMKDGILILDFAKEKALLRELEGVVARTDYDRGETLKVVVGTTSVKLFVDEAKSSSLRKLLEAYRIRGRPNRVAEFSLTFPEVAMRTRGVVATLTREFAVHDIVIAELLTSSPELLVYLDDASVPEAYDVLRGLQASSDPEGSRAPGRSPGDAPGPRRAGGRPGAAARGRGEARAR